MGNHTKIHDQPPTPGGDPDRPNTGVPDSPAAQEKDRSKGKDKSGYGHIGNNEVPRAKNAPPPHQIF